MRLFISMIAINCLKKLNKNFTISMVVMMDVFTSVAGFVGFRKVGAGE